MTFRGQFHQPLATAFAIGDTRENPFASNFKSLDRWAAVYTAHLIVPETGLYGFYVVADDEVILMIDDCKVLSSTRVGKAVYGGCYLAAGIHTFYFGLFEITGDAYADLYVKQPSESAYKLLPGAWLTPDAGAAKAVGKGTVAADAGTVTTVGTGVDSGFDSGFAGMFAAANGGLVQKSGGGVMAARYVSGDVAVNGGELFLYGGDTFGTVRATDGGTVRLFGGTIRNLSGDGKAAFGHVYTVPRIDGDADSGFSTNKTYTHLVNFPVGDGNVAVINGVRVNNTGTWSWGGTKPTGSWGNDSGTTATGFERLVYRFTYNSVDFSVNLSGLTAGRLYDFRLYFRSFGTRTRPVTFIFSRNGQELGQADWDPDLDENGKQRTSNTAVGCRYVADASGTVTVRVISHVSADKCHFYGFSNELLGDAGDIAEAVSLVPATGETARLTGGISGTASLSLDGVGTQVLGGEIALTAPLAVNAGRLVLESGATVTAGVTVASGAAVELQGSAQVNGLSGAGALCLGLGDNDPWGALQADGTFAAPEWPRRVNISGDADSGIAPFKTYTHFFNPGHGSNTVLLVNGVPVTCVADKSGTGTVHTDYHHGHSLTGLPQTQMLTDNESRNAPIKMASTNAMWPFFNRFQYADSMTLTLNGLTAGKTYELRFYVRKWTGTNRPIALTYNDGANDKSYIFNEDGNTTSDEYVALRYTATGESFAAKTAKQAGSEGGFHVYAFSNEEVADHVRVVKIDADAAFSGAISGNGELRKTGAGTWTLSGSGTASGAWTVAEGALVLDGATATAGSVAVAAGASFGGVGTAGGDVGVASGATLLIGAGSSVGTLALGGDLAVASGAALKVAYSQSRASALTAAGKVTLPASLTVTALPTTAGAALAGRTPLITAGTELSGPTDFTGWSVVDEDGNAIRGAKLSYGEDGKSVWLARPIGTLLFFH